MGSFSDGVIDAAGHVADHCPHHRRDSSFECVWRAWLNPLQLVSVQQTRARHEEHGEVRLYSCLNCKGCVVVYYRWGKLEPRSSHDPSPLAQGPVMESRVLHPRIDAPQLPDAVPQPVASLWREAAICAHAGGLRGAAACLRAAVEQVAKLHGITTGTVEAKIDALAAQTSLNPDLVTALHDTRLTANWSMHDGVSFSADEVADLSELVREVVEILYVQPAARSALAAARAARRGGESA